MTLIISQKMILIRKKCIHCFRKIAFNNKLRITELYNILLLLYVRKYEKTNASKTVKEIYKIIVFVGLKYFIVKCEYSEMK